MAEKLYFEDVQTGDEFVGETVTVAREKILSFAAEFDDQPMHMDTNAARAMGLKDIIAPGAYTFALMSKSQRAVWKQWHMLPGGLGINVSFLLPVYANDTITAHMKILATRPSSKPTRGWLDTRIDFLNQNGKIALQCTAAQILTCRTQA